MAIALGLPLQAAAQKAMKVRPATIEQQTSRKMRVDIWSDVMCPFCYIGKRHFEEALKEFKHGGDVEVVWHSFQLDPDARPQPGKDAYTYLAERKGQSVEWSRQAHKHVTEMAVRAGLHYDFDKVVVANSYDAHRVLQLAKKYGKGDEMEEQLFRGHFTEGKDVGDHKALTEMATAIGLDAAEVAAVLNSDAYAAEVQADIETAAKLGINGVPFFVINNKYGVSGAQPAGTFVQALDKAWKEYAKERGGLTMMDGEAPACEPDGECK